MEYIALLISIKYKKTADQAFEIAERMLRDENFNIKKYKHKWTKEEVQDLQKLRKEGLKYRELEEIFCCSKFSICPNLKKEV